LIFRGPQGVFTLPAILDKELFLVCTGAGVAPFRSMLHHIKNTGTDHKKIYLIFGSRKKEDLLYYNELTALQSELPKYHYLPTLSREQWEGKTGYVHAVYEELCAGRQPASFFLCGWKEMIDEAKKRIQEMGYEKKSIHLELYG
jgi:CDP-4-dehydro-6-deoxyglucose reductase